MKKTFYKLVIVCAILTMTNCTFVLKAGADSLKYYPEVPMANNKPDFNVTDDILYHPGWPVTLDINSNRVWPGIVSPVVADLDNNGQKEIIITPDENELRQKNKCPTS